MSFISKIANTVFDSDGSSVTRIGSTSFTSSGKSVSDFEIPKAGDTFFHGGKTYTRIGNSLFRSDGKSWSSAGKLSDADVRSIVSGDDQNRF